MFSEISTGALSLTKYMPKLKKSKCDQTKKKHTKCNKTKTSNCDKTKNIYFDQSQIAQKSQKLKL